VRLHGIARPFCPYVSQTRALWQNLRNLCPHSYATWKIVHPSFMSRRLVGRGNLWTWNFWPNWPRWSKNPNFHTIFDRSASAVTLTENVQLSRAFQWAQAKQHTFPLAPPPSQRGTQKHKIAVFCQKVQFTWRKSATKFLCVNTVSYKVVRHSLTYLSMQNRFAGTSHTTWKFGRNWPTLLKRRFSTNIRSYSASAVNLAKEFNSTNRKSTTSFAISLR